MDGGTAPALNDDCADDVLHRLERLAAVGRLTSGAAHEFNNLMTIVLGNVEFLERELKAGDARIARYLSFLRIAAERGTRLSSQLLSFSARRTAPPEPISLNETIEDLTALMRTALSADIKLDLQQDLWLVRDDPALVEMMVFGLAAGNRRDGALSFDTANVKHDAAHKPDGLAPGDYVMIAIHDSAAISAQRIHEAREFAQARQGGVHAERVPPAGTTVRIYLPKDSDVSGF
jgi:hypothetical protein